MKKIKELFTKPVIIGLASVAVVAGGGTAAGVHMHNENVRQEQAAKQKAKKAAAEKAEATRKKYNELLKTVDFQLQNSIFTGAESASKETLQGNLTELTKRLQEKDVYEGDYKLCDKLAKDVQTIYDQSKTIAEGKDAEAKNVDPAGYGEFYTADMKTQVEGFRTAYDTAYKAGKYLDASTAIDNMMNVFRTAEANKQNAAVEAEKQKLAAAKSEKSEGGKQGASNKSASNKSANKSASNSNASNNSAPAGETSGQNRARLTSKMLGQVPAGTNQPTEGAAYCGAEKYGFSGAVYVSNNGDVFYFFDGDGNLMGSYDMMNDPDYANDHHVYHFG